MTRRMAEKRAKAKRDVYVSPEMHEASLDDLIRLIGEFVRMEPETFTNVKRSPDSDVDLQMEIFGELDEIESLPSYQTAVAGHSIRHVTGTGLGEIAEEAHKRLRNQAKPLFDRMTENNPMLEVLNETFLTAEQAFALADDAYEATSVPYKFAKASIYRFHDARPDEKLSDVVLRDLRRFLAKLPKTSGIDELKRERITQSLSRIGEILEVIPPETEYVEPTRTERVKALARGIFRRGKKESDLPDREELAAEIIRIRGDMEALFQETARDIAGALNGGEFVITLPIVEEGQTREQSVTLPNFLVENSQRAQWPAQHILWSLSHCGDRVNGRKAVNILTGIVGREAERLSQTFSRTMDRMKDEVAECGMKLDEDALIGAPIRDTLAYFAERNKTQLLICANQTLRIDYSQAAKKLLGWIGYEVRDGELVLSAHRMQMIAPVQDGVYMAPILIGANARDLGEILRDLFNAFNTGGALHHQTLRELGEEASYQTMAGEVKDVDALSSFNPSIAGHSIRHAEAVGIPKILDRLHRSFRNQPQILFKRVRDHHPEIDALNECVSCAERGLELVQALEAVLDPTMRKTAFSTDNVLQYRFGILDPDDDPAPVLRDQLARFEKSLRYQHGLPEALQFTLQRLSKEISTALDQAFPLDGSAPDPAKARSTIRWVKPDAKAQLDLQTDNLFAFLRRENYTMNLPVIENGVTVEKPVTLPMSMMTFTRTEYTLLEALWAFSEAGNHLNGRAARDTLSKMTGQTSTTTGRYNDVIKALCETAKEQGVVVDADALTLNPLRVEFAKAMEQNKDALVVAARLENQGSPLAVKLLNHIGYNVENGALAATRARQDFEAMQAKAATAQR